MWSKNKIELNQNIVQEKSTFSTYLPISEFSNADFPAFLDPKTKHWKTFRCDCCRLRSNRLLLVIWKADEGSPVYPMYIKLAKLLAGSRSVISAHCNYKKKKSLRIVKFYARTSYFISARILKQLINFLINYLKNNF